MTTTVTNPIDARLDRIRRLEALRDRITTELLEERAALRRIVGHRAGSTANIVPPGTDPADVRDWGRRHGWTIANRGRMPADLIRAYTQANP